MDYQEETGENIGLTPAIHTRGLQKNYEDVEAVKGLDLDVASGRILGLVGPNGAGKTTALRCLAGILPPTGGSVSICGIDLLQEPVDAKQLLAFIPDTPHLFDYLTVSEHMAFIARIYGVQDAERRGLELLKEFDLQEKKDVLPQGLSRGMRQKLAICMGFLHEPRVLFLDEPLTGLDPRGIRHMKDSIVQQAREGGSACIVSSHQLELVEEICDEVFIIKDGRKIVSGTVQKIRSLVSDSSEDISLEEIFFRVTGDGGHDEPGDAGE